MIRNKKTGQIYIGQSKNIEKRFRDHCSALPIDVAIRVEGEKNFDFIILEETSENELLEKEAYWIEHYNTHYNDWHYNRNTRDGKYTLWNVNICHYDKGNMYSKGRLPNPCKCFLYNYNGYRIKIGEFHDWISIYIINQLVEEAINDEVK